LVIGAGTYVNRFTMFDASDSIEVGRNCLIGPFCYITDHDHGTEPAVVIAEQPLVSSPVRIGSNVWIGAGAIILKGTRIGDGAVIGAGAVVTHDVRAGEKVAGVPARTIGSRLPTTAGEGAVSLLPSNAADRVSSRRS
jgi:acetyltransferase-like isoleucine patch superfamily enzyme